MLFSSLDTITMLIKLDRYQSIHSFFKTPKVQQLFEQRFRDRVSTTKMTI